MKAVPAALGGIAVGALIASWLDKRWGGDIGAFLVSIPQPVATIIAAIAGLAVVAWQARKGFEAIIQGQNHRAKIEADARIDQDHLDRRQRFDEKARDQLVALCETLDEYHFWTQQAERRYLWGNEVADVVSPMNRAMAITSMYFPSMLPKLIELDQAGDRYLKWLVERGVARLSAGTASAHQVNSGEEFLSAHEEHYVAYASKRIGLLSALRQLGQAELSASKGPDI